MLELFDPIIRDTHSLLHAPNLRRWAYDPRDAWEDAGKSELIMRRDTAFELGGGENPSVNYCCVSSDNSAVPRDETVLIGPDLDELNADCAYARIVIASVDSLPEKSEDLYKAICDLSFVKYHVFPKGFMTRISPDSFQERVRVSCAALEQGISFRRLGAAFIRKYKENPSVKQVKIVFITDNSVDYNALMLLAQRVNSFTKALDHALSTMRTDCTSCQMKPICDEFEGLRDLHFKQAR